MITEKIRDLYGYWLLHILFSLQYCLLIAIYIYIWFLMTHPFLQLSFCVSYSLAYEEYVKPR